MGLYLCEACGGLFLGGRPPQEQCHLCESIGCCAPVEALATKEADIAMARCEYYTWDRNAKRKVRCEYTAEYLVKVQGGNVWYRCREHKDKDYPVSIMPLIGVTHHPQGWVG